MVVLMVCAAVYAVVQLVVLGSLARSSRISTALLAIVTGFFGCGAVVLVAELAYTRTVSLVTGISLSQVVRTASYTVDPFIEEIVKIIPLLLIAVVSLRRRVQWGLVDFLILGAGIGSGFALAEAMLRYGSSAAKAVSDASGGYLVAVSLSPPEVRGLGAMLTSWLPAPVGSWDLFGPATSGLNLHLLWTALAGLGIGVLVRTRGWYRLLGLLPLLYAAVDHAASNFAISTMPDGFVGVIMDLMDAFRLRLPLVIFLALIAATVLDLILVRPVRREHPELLLADERSRPYGSTVLARFGTVAPPWTALLATRFILLRRAAWFALATRHAGPPPRLVPLVADLAQRIDHAGDRAVWQQAAHDTKVLPISPGRRLRDWRVIVWLGLMVPPFVYFVAGGVPLTGELQNAMESRPVTVLVAIFLTLGVVYGCWQLVLLVRQLPNRLRQPWAEGVLRASLRIGIGVCLLALSTGSLVLVWLRAADGSDRVIDNYHLLDALGSALLLAAMVMLLAGLFMMFPPGGALVLAGTGEVLVGGLTASQALTAAGVLGASGVLLMAGPQYGNGNWDDDDWEDWEDRNFGDRSRGGRQGGKGGRQQRGRGSGGEGAPGNNQTENRQAADAIKEAERQLGKELDDDQLEQVHRAITGQNYNYHEIVETVLGLFG
ncbi:MAG TPA: PrsW family glutamic-type intramembrane protease [Microlunatus sp.]